MDHPGVILTLVFLALLQWGFPGAGADRNNRANRHYESADYDEALRRYQSAREAAPDDPRIAYNMANTMHQRSDFSGAQTEYTRALSGDSPALQAQLFYNLGNNFYRLGKLDAAQTAYERTLLINPDDMDAKFNIEFIMQKQEQEKKEQSQEDQERKEDEDKQEGGRGRDQEDQKEDEGKQEGKGGQDQEDQKEDDPQEGDEGKDKDSDEQAQEEAEQEQEGAEQTQEKAKQEQEKAEREKESRFREGQQAGMSQEEAERILDAWQGREASLRDLRESSLRSQRKERMTPAPPFEVEKDW